MVVVWAVAAAMVTAVGGQTTETAASCSTGPSVAATVFAILLLLALAALGIVMYQYIWKPRHASSLEKVVLAENGQQESRFAFDNPYMVEDDDIGSKSTLPCHNILAINEKSGTSRSGDQRTPKKHNFCVLTPTSSQPQEQADDDPAINEDDQVTVPLRGHDFTGLGLTVQGSMRDGIFVSSVSQHGPALESGLVQAGDRVTAVTVSFNRITLEDATAILSQSAPYDVQLHLQKAGSGHRKVTTPTGTGDRRQQSSSNLSGGKSHGTGRLDRSPGTGSSSTSSIDSTQHDKKTAVEMKVENDPVKETVQHVQRDHSAGSPSGGFREMAVDVPEHMDGSRPKHGTEASSASSSTAKARHLGVQVLPPLSPTRGTESGPEAPGSEPREGRRSLALGVPSLRLATRDPADSGHDVETCLTKLANDQPCGRDLDDETGEPSAHVVEDADHRRVRMGTSSFNKQERLARKEMSDQPDKPEPAKRQGSVDDTVFESEVNVEVKYLNYPSESDKSEVERINLDNDPEVHASPDSDWPANRTNEKGNDEVEFKKLSSEFTALLQEGEPQHDYAELAGKLEPGSDAKERAQSRSASSSWDRSSPVKERPQQMSFAIPDEMRLAAGVAQDRRSRADRPARSALFGSKEVLVDDQKTPTDEKPTAVGTELQKDKQETVTDERPPPLAMPRTVAPDTLLSDSKKNDLDGKMDSFDNEDDMPKPELKEEELSRPSTQKDKIDKPVEEEELKKTVRSINVYEEDAPSPKKKIDKLEAFREVLSLTPSKSPPEKREKREEEVDVIGETVEKGHAERCPCDGPTSSGTAPRITGEVTGIVEVGERKSRTAPVIVGVTESRLRPAGSEERVAPPSSAAVSRARSEAAALPEAVRAIRAARRRDSGPVAEVLSRDAATTSGRLCASTGDLTRSEPPRADSPLGRTVSMQTGVGDQTNSDSRVSAAARARDQMDLSRLGQQEGYAVSQPRHIMSITSSNESLDTESIQEEPTEAADRPPSAIGNGINGHSPQLDGETPAPSAVPIGMPSEEGSTAEITVNGIDTGMEEISKNRSEGTVDNVEAVAVPPTLPRVVQSEPKRNSDSDSAEGRDDPAHVGPLTLSVTAAVAITTPSVTPVVPPVIIVPSLDVIIDHSSTEKMIADSTPDLVSSAASSGVPLLETEAGETAPATRSRRGPPPTPPPRSPVSRQAASSPREPEEFEITAVELDSVMLSHEEFLRQEAERRAHVCRLAANFRTSREPSPALE